MCLVALHVLAFVKGWYASAPDITVVQPSTGVSIDEQMTIAVRADDGPKGSGVQSVEYQLDSTAGAWTPLALESSSMTYTGTWKTAAAAEGEHALYIRARDFTGNARTVLVSVKVVHGPTRSNEGQGLELKKDEALDVSWSGTWALDLPESRTRPRG